MRHQVLTELFRNCGELAPALLKHCSAIDLAHCRVTPRSSDLSQVAPAEYRADAVVELRDRRSKVTAAVVVEIQLRIDADKQYSWPVYVTALRAELRCPVTLLVLTTRTSVARWARRVIDLGHPGMQLTPVVIDFADLPRITDAAHAHGLPELAVLSAMAHPEIGIAKTAICTIDAVPSDRKRLYLDLVMTALPDAVRRQLESRMIEGYVYQSEYARRYFFQGVEKGKQRGRREGRQEGIKVGHERGVSQGVRDGLREAALELARGKLSSLTARQEAAIAAIGDKRSLTRLISALGRAQTARDACGVLAAIAGRRRA